MKRYRDENGRLTMSLQAVKEATEEEGKNYYLKGHIYLYENIEYVLVETGELYHFQSFDGRNLFIPADCLGTFLPDVAADDLKLTFIE